MIKGLYLIAINSIAKEINSRTNKKGQELDLNKFFFLKVHLKMSMCDQNMIFNEQK